MDSNAASDEIKSMAINGLFDEVETKFGKKKTVKAANYVEVKLQSLKDKRKSGHSLDNVLYATPFMMFALTKDGLQITDIAQAFRQQSGASDKNTDGSQLSLISSEETNSQKNTPSASSENNDVASSTPDLPSRAVVTPVREAAVPISTPVIKTKSFQAPATLPSTDEEPKEPKEKKQKKKSKGDTEKKERSKKEGKEKKEKITSVQKGKKTKVEKDPDAPKRAQGSYLYFAAAMRTMILEETPGLSMVEVAKEMGKRWKELCEEDRQVYTNQAATDKARYEAEMAEYQAKGGQSKLSVDIHNAAPLTKKKRVKQVARASKEAESDSASSDSDATCSENEHETRPTKRRAASDAKKNIRKAVTHSNAPDRAPVTKGTHGDDSGKSSKKRRFRLGSADTESDAKVGQKRKIVGIKQEHLCEDEDLLHVQFNSRATATYPEPLALSSGLQVMLALEPYRNFLTELPANAIDGETRQDIERICSLQTAVVQCTLISDTQLPCTTTTPEEEEETHCYSLLTVTVNKKQYRVLYVDFASPLLTCDTFLVEKSKYEKSLRASWLVVNAQVRRLFATADPDIAEWQEGSIYHIRSDLETNPYGAVHVVWMQQECDTNHWLYGYEQTDTECSPWDLELSSYVLEANIKPPVVPRALLVGAINPASVIEFIKTFDASEQFNVDMSTCQDPDYLTVCPNPAEDSVDLVSITKLCRRGRYDDEGGKGGVGAGVGIAALFADLQRMVAHSKALNKANPFHLPYRLADMLGKAIYRLKATLAEKRGIASLQSSLEQDREDEREATVQAAAVEL